MRFTPLATLLLCGTFSGAALAANWQTLPETAPAPEDNPTTEAKVELGKQLFFDPRISATGTVSCNSCHNVMEGGDDSRPVSMGVHGKTGGRSAPTVWNAAFQSVQFWDGRAPTLEAQALGPIGNPVEMGMKEVDMAADRLAQLPGYQEAFSEVFGGDAPVTKVNMAKAIAAYERTLITPNSPYDRYVEGDKDALSAKQVRGMKAFAEVGCTSCHSGANFSGPKMAKGQGFFMKFPTYSDNAYVEKYDLMSDEGRKQSTGNQADAHMYRVPTLRNIALTAPYFHNGAVPNLEEAVRVMAKTQLNKKLGDEQVSDIAAFLDGLTGPFPEQTLPQLPSKAGHSVVVK